MFRLESLKVPPSKSRYMMVRNDSVSLPKFYNNGEGDFEIVNIPMCKSLKVGQFYTFRIRKKSDRSLAIINGDERCLEKDWTSEGNGVYSTTFMPRATGRLTFALKNNATKSNYNGVVYRIHRVPCLRIGLFLGSEDGIAVELPYAL